MKDLSPHLTIDELIDRLYDVAGAEAHDEHLTECAECAARLRLFERRRAVAVDVEAEVLNGASVAFLANQRGQILMRAGHRPGFRLHWVPAALVGGLVAAVALVPRFSNDRIAAPEKAVQQETVEDQLFREVFSLEAAEEPRAASPIRGLFEAAVAGEQPE